MRKAWLFLHLTLLLLPTVLWAAGAITPVQPVDSSIYRSPRLVEMDSILDQAPNFRNFAAKPALRDQLFHSLENYFGKEKVTRLGFDAVVDELVKLDKEVPGFGDKLWQPRKVDTPTVIKYSESDVYPYEMKQSAWVEKLSQFENDSKNRAGKLAEIQDHKELERVISSRLEKMKTDTIEFNRTLNARTDLKGKQASALREDFNRRLTASPEGQELIGYFVHRSLVDKETTRDALRSGNTQAILEKIDEIQRGAIDGPGIKSVNDVPAPLRTALREELPHSQRIINSADLISRAADAGAVEERFYEVHRPIYAAFRGLPTNECIAGGCIQGQTRASGVRVAVPVLDDVKVRFSEQVFTGSEKKSAVSPFQGFVEIAPIQSEETGKVFGSLTIGHSGFRKQVQLIDAETGRVSKSNLYELWRKKAPTYRMGYVIGESSSMDNAQAYVMARTSPSYLLGETVGDSGKFKHLPENRSLVEAIVRAASPIPYNYAIRGEMVIDAMVPDAGNLTRIDPRISADLAQELSSATPEQKIAATRKISRLKKEDRERAFSRVEFLSRDDSSKVRAAFKIRQPAWLTKFAYRDNWNKTTWRNATELFKDANDNTIEILSYGLSRQKPWPPKFWDVVIVASESLKPSSAGNYAIWEAIEKQDHWPPQVWSKISKDVSVAHREKREMTDPIRNALATRKDWPHNVWKLILESAKGGESKSLRAIVALLSRQEKFSGEVWREVPALMKLVTADDQIDLRESLWRQKDWPQDFRDQILQGKIETDYKWENAFKERALDETTALHGPAPIPDVTVQSSTRTPEIVAHSPEPETSLPRRKNACATFFAKIRHALGR